MFKNLKIGVRLGIGFGLVIILLIVISTLAYLRVGAINAEVEDMVKDKYPKVQIASDVLEAINTNARAMRNALLVDRKSVV